ncbi:MAG: rod shape-determining protein MreC [Clostridia bacterium]|nr:rod shape-determining protein MreC [Clostridia bacterium]
MHFFFRSKKVRLISAISILLVISIIICGFATNWSAPQSNITSSVLSPIQNFFAGVSDSFNSYFKKMESKEKLLEQIKELKKELNEKNNLLIDHEEIVRQNDFYKDFLEIKENNPTHKYTSARVISRNNNDTYASFTIDKGTVDGIEVYDPIITAEGLVGYVCDAYSTQSTVMTILNPKINVSAIDNHSRDAGIISGDPELSLDGLTKMMYIPSDNTVASGNFIVTSGDGGIYPGGLIIGTVVEIKTSTNKISCEAKIQPIVDFDEVSDVMVITDF